MSTKSGSSCCPRGLHAGVEEALHDHTTIVHDVQPARSACLDARACGPAPIRPRVACFELSSWDDEKVYRQLQQPAKTGVTCLDAR
ncbi:DNA ligase [Trichinella spiralis]|uniref:DNA ligase n=1 Tax=Trichinella spiralis TaxID=6334 RepID=A0ABR3K673_TRISP